LHHEVQSTAYSESATTESYAGYGLGYAVFIWWKGIKTRNQKKLSRPRTKNPGLVVFREKL